MSRSSPTGADFAQSEGTAEHDKTVISKSPPIAADSKVSVPLRPQDMGRELEGQRLNHFMLEEFVGGGGMGAVFRAIDTELGRTVAVKVVANDATDEEVLRRFKNEAQSAARLDHPNIARVYYVGRDRGWNYIVFEYIEGVNVRDLVDHKGPLSLDEAIHYTRQVAEALDHASRRDVVHRDIKPSNVLVMPDGGVKLVDMGLARLHQVEAAEADLTASGVTLGTFDYISPEQARDPRNTDVRSDLYSLGCTIYFMLTGLPPFPEGTVLQKLLSHSSEDPPDPRRLRPDLPDELVKIVLKLLAKHPDKRYQQPSELIGELILLADDLGLPHAEKNAQVWVTTEAANRNWIERHLPWIAPTAILIALVLVVEFASRPAGTLRIPEPKLPEGTAQAREANVESNTTNTVESTPVESAAPSSESNAAPPIPNTTTTPPEPTARPPAPPTSPAPATTSTTTVAVGSAPDASTSRDSSTGNNGTSAPSESSKVDVADTVVRPPSETVVNSSPPTTNGPVPSLDADDMRAELAKNERVKTLFVDPSSAAPSDDETRVVESLSKAARMLGEFPNVREIILRGDLFVEEPFSLADRSLEIRAAAGYQPTLVFGRNHADFTNTRQMIRLVGGGVSWRGLHFRLEIPATLSGTCALFSINQLETLRFANCSMTVVNANANGTMGTALTTFFDVDAPNSPGGMMAQAGSMSQPPQRIDLSNFIARGEATFIHVPEATPLRLQWDHGMLATTERLLEMGGYEIDPKQLMSEIELTRVVVRADQGLCLLDSSQRPHQIGLRVELQESIIVTPPGIPIVEHVGLPDDELTRYHDRRFAYEDRNCCYPNVDPANAIRWRVSTKDNATPTVYFFEDLDELWYLDMGVTFRNPWLIPPPLKPAHEQVPADFATTSSDSDSLRLGADPVLLPEIPLLSK